MSVASHFSTIEEAVEAMQQGEVIIVVDAEDRENEGDFICAAEKVTPEIVNFMITHGRGQLCMPILPDVCERLKLSPMVESNTAPLGTDFTVPVDHRSTRTGITAQERATTIRAIFDPASKPADFVRPGHCSPLVAKEGGVLRRAGHTEATVDLARLAGLIPGGRALRNPRRDAATGPIAECLFELAERFELPIISIEELIRYRRLREKLVYRDAEAKLPTQLRHGQDHRLRREVRIAAAAGARPGRPGRAAGPAGAAALVVLHGRPAGLAPLRLRRPAAHGAGHDQPAKGAGVLVYLPQEGRGIGLVEKIKAYACRTRGSTPSKPTWPWATRPTSRDYGVGIQLLKDLGLRKVRLLTNNPKKTDAFIYGGFDLEVVDQVPIMPPIHEHNARYLATKRDKLGHRLPQEP